MPANGTMKILRLWPVFVGVLMLTGAVAVNMHTTQENSDINADQETRLNKNDVMHQQFTDAIIEFGKVTQLYGESLSKLSDQLHSSEIEQAARDQRIDHAIEKMEDYHR